MILSEFAGAAQSLNGSIVVNPWDSQQVADAIFEAVTMDAETRAENHKKLFKVRYTLFPSFICPASMFPTSDTSISFFTFPRMLIIFMCIFSMSTSTRQPSGVLPLSGR